MDEESARIGFYVDQIKALEERIRALEMDLDLANKIGAHHRKVAQLRAEQRDELRMDLAALKNQLQAREQTNQFHDGPGPLILQESAEQKLAKVYETAQKFLRGELP